MRSGRGSLYPDERWEPGMTAEGWRQRFRNARREVYALYLACQDSRVPWYAKVAAGLVVAYAVSPIDLIPDFIPVLGYVDDVLILPIGVLLVRRMIPYKVMAEHRTTAADRLEATPLFTIAGSAITVAIWIALLALLVGAYVAFR
jgi:uncharacterized membrane protein YkvA (DUF1232 family)